MDRVLRQLGGRRWDRLDNTEHLCIFFDEFLEFIFELLSSRDNEEFRYKGCHTGVVIETQDTVKICFVRRGSEGAQVNTTVEVEHRDGGLIGYKVKSKGNEDGFVNS